MHAAAIDSSHIFIGFWRPGWRQWQALTPVRHCRTTPAACFWPCGKGKKVEIVFLFNCSRLSSCSFRNGRWTSREASLCETDGIVWAGCGEERGSCARPSAIHYSHCRSHFRLRREGGGEVPYESSFVCPRCANFWDDPLESLYWGARQRKPNEKIPTFHKVTAVQRNHKLRNIDRWPDFKSPYLKITCVTLPPFSRGPAQMFFKTLPCINNINWFHSLTQTPPL